MDMSVNMAYDSVRQSGPVTRDVYETVQTESNHYLRVLG